VEPIDRSQDEIGTHGQKNPTNRPTSDQCRNQPQQTARVKVEKPVATATVAAPAARKITATTATGARMSIDRADNHKSAQENRSGDRIPASLGAGRFQNQSRSRYRQVEKKTQS
jgi:hypothetical protein